MSRTQAYRFRVAVYAAAFVCLGCGVSALWIAPHRRTGITQAWYYSLQQHKLIAGPAHRIPPIEISGETCVGAVVYACPGQHPRFDHLERFQRNAEGVPVRYVTTPTRIRQQKGWVSRHSNRTLYRRIQKQPNCPDSSRAPLQVLPRLVGSGKRWQRSEIIIQPRK